MEGMTAGNSTDYREPGYDVTRNYVIHIPRRTEWDREPTNI